MRRIAIVLMAAGLAAGWTSCKKSKNNTPDPVIPRGISATINGSAWSASPSLMSFASFGNWVAISGYDSATGRTIDLLINNFKNKGTFKVPQANDSIFYANDYGVLGAPIAATSGSISIQLVNDSAVGGTFSFTADSITVTNGTFNWNYQ